MNFSLVSLLIFLSLGIAHSQKSTDDLIARCYSKKYGGTESERKILKMKNGKFYVYAIYDHSCYYTYAYFYGDVIKKQGSDTLYLNTQYSRNYSDSFGKSKKQELNDSFLIKFVSRPNEILDTLDYSFSVVSRSNMVEKRVTPIKTIKKEKKVPYEKRKSDGNIELLSGKEMTIEFLFDKIDDPISFFLIDKSGKKPEALIHDIKYINALEVRSDRFKKNYTPNFKLVQTSDNEIKLIIGKDEDNNFELYKIN